MNSIKKITVVLSSILIAHLLFLASADFVFSAPDLGGKLVGEISKKSGYDTNDSGPEALSQKVGTIIRIALSLVGMIFFALAVYAGFLWMTASGNDEQVGKATDILKTAVIGLIIALSAYSITYFVTLRLMK